MHLLSWEPDARTLNQSNFQPESQIFLGAYFFIHPWPRTFAIARYFVLVILWEKMSIFHPQSCCGTSWSCPAKCILNSCYWILFTSFNTNISAVVFGEDGVHKTRDHLSFSWRLDISVTFVHLWILNCFRQVHLICKLKWSIGAQLVATDCLVVQVSRKPLNHTHTKVCRWGRNKRNAFFYYFV